MTSTRSLISPAAIRDASLPKTLRGFDETATRRLLSEVAETVQALMDERDTLRQSLEEPKQEAHGDPQDPAAIGNVLLAAQHAGEELVAHARTTAEQITAGAAEASERLLEETRRITAEAERELDVRRDELQRLRVDLDAERQRVVDEARAEAEELVTQSRARLDALVAEEQTMREFVADRRKEFVDMLQSALDQVDHRTDEPEVELTTVLKSRVSDRAAAD
jgi:cell division septum initiation protein DivIVA